MGTPGLSWSALITASENETLFTGQPAVMDPETAASRVSVRLAAASLKVADSPRAVGRGRTGPSGRHFKFALAKEDVKDRIKVNVCNRVILVVK